MQTTELHRIVEQYEPKVRAYFGRRIANDADVDDLVQETMCAIIMSYPRFRGDSKVATWIYAICANQIYNWFRNRDRRNKLFTRLISGYFCGERNDDNISRLTVEVAYERLPREMKNLFVDRYRRGLSVKQIAGRYECPEGTVKYRLYLLRIELRNILG